MDAKSGVSGAGRDPKADLHFGEVNESVRAYGIFTHRHIGEIEQELAGQSPAPDANPGARGIDFLPHLVPMTRGILSACHVRTTRPVTQAELDDALCRRPTATSRSSRSRPTPPATKHVLGCNEFRVFVQGGRADRPHPRDRRARQPGEGRRGPGDPGLQRRPRAARARRPAPASRSRPSAPARPARGPPMANPSPIPCSRRSPTDLPPVERAARMPGGFCRGRRDGRDQGLRAPGPRAGRRATADPSRRPRCSRRTASRPRPSGSRGPTCRPRAARDRGRGYARAVIATSGSANAATGPRRRRPGRHRRGRRGGPGHRPGPRAPPLDRASSGRGCPWTGSRRRSPASRPGGSPRRTTRSRRRPSRSGRPTRRRRWPPSASTLPAADGGGTVTVTVTGICKGVGHDPPAHGDDALGPPHGRDRGPGHAADAAPVRRGHDMGPAVRGRRHEHQRHRVPARVRRGRRGIARTPDAGARAALAAAIEAVARDLARQQAARRRGRHGAHHLPGLGRGRRRRRPGHRAGRDLVVAGQGGGPRPGRELGPDRGRRGQRARRGSARSSRRRACSPDEAGRAGRTACGRGPGEDADRDRRPSRLRRAARRARRHRQGRGPRVHGRGGGPHPRGRRPGQRHGRGVRLPLTEGM